MPEQYDITCVPINAEDYLVIEDRENRHVFKVEGVVGDPGTRRELRVERIQSTDPGIKRRTTLTLDPTHPVMGLVVTEAQFQAGGEGIDIRDAGSINNLIVTELVDLLAEMTHSKNSAPVEECMKALQKLGILPPDDSKAKRHMLNVVHANDDQFRSRGGWIKLLKSLKKTGSTPVRPGVDVVEISRHHLDEMFRALDRALFHALQSGLLTGGKPVRMVDLDVQ